MNWVSSYKFGIRTIAPWLGLGFGSRLGLVLRVGGNQTIASEESCSLNRVRVWVRVNFEVLGGNCPRTINSNILYIPPSFLAFHITLIFAL